MMMMMIMMMVMVVMMMHTPYVPLRDAAAVNG